MRGYYPVLLQHSLHIVNLFRASIAYMGHETVTVNPLATGLNFTCHLIILTLRLLMSYIYGAPSKARNANVVYIWTYVWQR